nr:MAG TPA: hypothetical protein [Caudoviricetes sp.]
MVFVLIDNIDLLLMVMTLRASLKKYTERLKSNEEIERRKLLYRYINNVSTVPKILPYTSHVNKHTNGMFQRINNFFASSFFGYHTFFFKIKAYSFLLEEVTSAILDATIVEHKYSLHISSLDIDVEIKRGKKLRNNCLRLFELKDDKEVSRHIKK